MARPVSPRWLVLTPRSVFEWPHTTVWQAWLTSASERFERLHRIHSVCKDFPDESSGIGCGGPVDDGMALFS